MAWTAEGRGEAAADRGWSRPVAASAVDFAYRPFRWSADGSRLALIYEVAAGDQRASVLEIDGVERARGRIDPDDVVLSADGRHVAAVVGEASGDYVLHDDRRYGPYKSLWGKPELSRDGAQVAFIATTGDDFAHAVVDGVAGPAGATRHGVTRIAFAADRPVVGYLRATDASDDSKRAVHLGDRVLAEGVAATELWISPDGARAAWLERTPEGRRLVVDGTPEPSFRDVATPGAGWSPDGGLFCYLATRDRKTFTIRVAGVGERSYELSSPVFLFPRPGQVAFVSYDGGVMYRETWTLSR